MKVLFNHSVPFFLAHGGVQIQIEQTKAALQSIGVDVQFLNWWDETQSGDIIHYFGRPQAFVVEFARKAGAKTVLSDLLTAQGSRPSYMHFLHGAALRLAGVLLPQSFGDNLPSSPYQVMDSCIALTPWEALLMQRIYGAPGDKVHVVPNGVESIFLDSVPSQRGKWLVCTAAITQRKRVLELAQAAVKAKTPIWIIGKPYSENDNYYRAFKQIAANNSSLVRYEGAIRDRARLASIYCEARGFALLSSMESQSLSALEAAACECPLLLSDLPWARCTFGGNAEYCLVNSNSKSTAVRLREFYDAAPSNPHPPKPLSWLQVARQIKTIYESVCKTSR